MGHFKLAAIQHQHVSDEARLKAVVEAFLLGEGYYQPSWRRLIHTLHKAEEIHMAEKIKTNAEPHQGEWVYVIIIIIITRALQSTYPARCICINLRAAGATLIYNVMHVFVDDLYLCMLGQVCA